MIFLITGVAGFIGSHLAEELIERGHYIIGVDNLFSGNLENIKNLKHDFIFYNIDATKYNDVAALINSLELKPDVYVNMAAACLLYSLKHPLEGFDIEVNLCKTMVKLAENKLVNRIVQFSSSEVYGGNGFGKPFDLNSVCNPKTTYAAGKFAADNLIKIYRDKFKINAFFIRPFNNFGERQENAIIPSTIKKILNNELPVILGEGNQSRDFMYVKDTVKIVANILESNNKDDVLLATGKKTTIEDIVKIISKKMLYKGVVEHKEQRELDVDQLIGKKYKFNYTSMDTALENTINWHKNRIIK